MKILFLMSFISLPLLAAIKPIMIDQVRSIDYDKNEATVTFWSTNQVYRLPANALVMPCLQNGKKAKQKVVMQMNNDAKIIESCKLYGGGTSGL